MAASVSSASLSFLRFPACSWRISSSEPTRGDSSHIGSVRIYPTYLLAASPIIAYRGMRKLGPDVFSLMLVPTGERTYYLGVEWTLVFECTYYVGLFLIALIGWHRYLSGMR